MKKIKSSTLRAIVILAVLVVVAIGYFTQVGIGNLSGFGWDVFAAICPLGYLESLVASKTFVPRALISFVLIVAAVLILGRVFCAWICPMPLWQRWIPGLKRKKKGVILGKGNETASAAETSESASGEASHDVILSEQSESKDPRDPQSPTAAGAPTPATAATSTAAATAVAAPDPAAETRGKPNRFKLDSRFGVLLGALASAAIFGFPVFCLICPVGLTFATVLIVMRLFAFGDLTWTVVVVPLVLIVEVVFLRKWCSKICPLGALISLVSGANKTLRPHVNDKVCLVTGKHTACFACSKACPEHIDVRRPAQSETSLNNCTKCRECADACPAHAITFPVLPKKQEGEREQEVR